MYGGAGLMMRRVLVGLLVSLVLVAPFALGAQAQTGCGTVSGSWTSIPAPDFPAGDRPMTAYAVHPLRPSTMFATNGTVVMRSTDGGCGWKLAYEPDPGTLPLGSSLETRVVSIDIPESPAGATMAFLTLAEKVGPAIRPRVLRSLDGGATWQPADAGLPPAGVPSMLRVAPGDPQRLYLGISMDAEGAPASFPVQFLYGSDDGGTSWTLRSNFQRSVDGGVIDVKVDPIDANSVWVGAASGLFHSTDGGRTYRDVDEFTGAPAGPVDVFHGQGPASIVAFKPGQGQGAASEDGGETWLSISSPGTPTSIAHGHLAQSRLMSSAGRVWVYAPNIFSWVDARAPRGEVTGLTADRSGIGFYGFTSSTIEIYRGPVGVSVEVPPGNLIRPDGSLIEGTPAPPAGHPELTPKQQTVRIPAGDSKTVPFSLKLPKVLSPVDIYFLVDTSSSQGPFIEAMVEALEDVVNEVNGSSVVARFGLGEYRNYPDSNPPRLGPEGTNQHEPNFVYRQRVDLTTDMDVLESALNSIRPAGGGHYNAQLAALYQTATGAGQDVDPPGPLGQDVARGQQADFAKDALRVALIVSDENYEDDPYDNDSTPPEMPQFEAVRDALIAKDIKQVGISIQSNGSTPATGGTDPDAPGEWGMLKMALDTDAVAPPTGVDCDGDGAPDIAENQGLVCEMTREELENGRGLAASIVNLVQAVRTRTAVGLSIEGREEITDEISPVAYESVVAEATKTLDFDVTFRCPKTLAGKRFPLELAATGLDERASATVVVVCGTLDAADGPPRVLPLVPLAGLIPLVPPAPPPPVTELASSTQAQAQSQAQAQAQASMAHQEQEEPQLAFVHAMHAMRAQMAEDYAMSSYRDRGQIPAPALALGAATVLMSTAFGLLVLRPRSRLRARRN